MLQYCYSAVVVLQTNNHYVKQNPSKIRQYEMNKNETKMLQYCDFSITSYELQVERLSENFISENIKIIFICD